MSIPIEYKAHQCKNQDRNKIDHKCAQRFNLWKCGHDASEYEQKNCTWRQNRCSK